MAKTIGQLTQATTLASSDEFIIEQSGLTKRVAASVVRGGLVNADIDAAAAIAGSKLADDAITTAKIDDDAVTTAKIDDDAVTTAKIDDDAVTTAKILDANVTPAKLSQPLTLATAQATTSGTSIDFTSIPSWVKRITVMFDGVSLSGSSSFLIQLGDSGGFETTNYSGGGARYGAGTISAVSYTTGLGANNTTASATYSGHIVWTNLTGNTWAGSLTLGASGGTESGCIGGSSKTLSATLDRIRLTTVNGTDTFDAGEVNIMYEG